MFTHRRTHVQTHLALPGKLSVIDTLADQIKGQ